MRYRTTAISSLGFALTFLLGACSDSGSGGPQPTPQEYDDVAKSVGSMVVGGGSGGAVASMGDSALIATGTYPLGFVTNASGTVEGTHFGVDYSYEVTCEDDTGTALDPCDDTTDSADVSVTWSGMLTASPHLSAMVDRTGHWSITGLQSDAPVFDGDGSFELDASVETGAVFRSYHLSCVSTYDSLVLDAVSPPHVMSGTIRYDIEGSRYATNDAGFEVDSSFSVTAEVVFEGSEATIVLDGERRYRLETATGQVTFEASTSP